MSYGSNLPLHQAFLQSHDAHRGANRDIVKNSVSNGNDFVQSFVRIHEAMNNPQYAAALAPKRNEISDWNRNIREQLEEDRRAKAAKMSQLRNILGSAPNLAGLNNQVGNILDDYNRNPSSRKPNQPFTEHARQKQQESLLIADEEFSPMNFDPRGVSHLDYAYPGRDWVPGPSQPATTTVKMNKKPKTPFKGTIEIDQAPLHQNPQYEPNNLMKSNIRHDDALRAQNRSSASPSKVTFANGTEPTAPRVKTPQSKDVVIAKKDINGEPASFQQQNYVAPPLLPTGGGGQQTPTTSNISAIPLATDRVWAPSQGQVREIQIQDPKSCFLNPKQTQYNLPNGRSGSHVQLTSTKWMSTATTPQCICRAWGVRSNSLCRIINSLLEYSKKVGCLNNCVVPKTAQLKVTKTLPENVLLQVANSNHLAVMDNMLVQRDIIQQGLNEPGDVKQEYKHFRHSLDDSYMLWRSGEADLKIYDVLKGLVSETIANFWKSRDVVTKPIGAVATGDANRIIGISILSKDETFISYYERTGPNFELIGSTDKQLIEQNCTSLNSLEVSLDGGAVFLGGTSISNGAKSITFYVRHFNKSFSEIDKLVLQDSEVTLPIVMKRIPGYDLIVVGCLKHLLILEYNLRKLKVVARIENVHTDFCVDLAVRGNTIYSKGIKEPVVKVINFNAPPSSLHPIAQSNLAMGKYPDFVPNKIMLDLNGILEKVTLSTNGSLIYTGGGQCMHLLKFDDSKKQYFQVKNEVSLAIDL
jgi:hypothetical protein